MNQSTYLKNENDQNSEKAGSSFYIQSEVCLWRSTQLSRGSNSKEITQSINQLEGAIQTLP